MTSPDQPLGEHQQQLRGSARDWTPRTAISPPPSQQQVQVQKESASSPVPPGFQSTSSSKDGTGAAAAPPGFISDHYDSSGYQVEGGEARGQQSSASSEPGSRVRGGDNNNPAQYLSSNTSGQAAAGVAGQGRTTSSLAAALAKSGEGGTRTSSFVNLAAVLGTGLAESMDDATSGDWNNLQAQFHHHHQQQQQQQQQQPHPQQQQQPYGQSNLQDLSLARQSRHAAARLIGASPPRADPLGLEVGSNYVGGAPTALSEPTNYNTSSSDRAATGLQAGFFTNAGATTAGATTRRDDDALADFKASVQNRRGGTDSPLGVFGSNPNRHSLSSDVGVTVMEPSDQRSLGGERDRGTRYSDVSGGVLGAMLQDHYQQQNPEIDALGGIGGGASSEEKCYECEVERGMRNLWVDDNNSEVGRASGSLQQQSRQIYSAETRSVGSQRSGGSHSQSSRQMAESELRPFIWDTRIPQQYQQHVDPSRCIAILRCANLHVPDVRLKCEAFGVLETFRSDFADRGIIFVSYYDIRSAQYAALELEGVLKQNDCSGCDARGVAVYYCVPLNASTQTDESRIILAGVPPYIGEHQLLDMLASYGSVRSLKREGGFYGGSSFEVEFHNVQDAKQAMLELSSTQPFGPDAVVEVGMRSAIERKRGRDLLTTIGRWRHGNKPSISPAASTGSRNFDAPRGFHPHDRPESSSSSSPMVAAPAEAQLVLGPDGRYSYMVVENRSGYPPSPHNPYGTQPPQHQTRHIATEAPRQQIVHGPNGQVYITTVSGPPPPSHHTTYIQGGPPPPRDYYPQSQHHHVIQQPHYPYDSRDRQSRDPYYSPHPGAPRPDHGSVASGHSHHQHPHSSNVSMAGGASITGHSAAGASTGGDENKDNKHLVLDLEAVEQGRDSRTSLMVRNIPNKYTQQMLLNEFRDNGLGPGVIDFFYLPIDFKNRCNRGYAFINFVDNKDILPFHRRYFGKHWSTFNSDKICDITYARIQGKAAMLKRFENSALMEKDEEYKPLVFVSHGPDKGKRIPFPEAAASQRH